MKVLVIDDDKVDRLMVRELLGDEFTVVEAKSGDDARELLHSEEVECVLLDYLIPGTDSLALLTELAAHELPVIMLTGEGNEEVAVRAMKQGAQDYINKRTLGADRLTQTISTAMMTVKLRRELSLKQKEVTHANDALKRKVKELQDLNRDLEDLIHLTAHDLREPLRNLCGFCGLLEKEIGNNLTADAAEYIDSIQAGSKRLASLIDDLRALSRIVYMKFEESAVDLNQVIDDVLADSALVLEQRKVEIKRKPLPPVSGSRTLLIELYRNLVSNALKYGEGDNLTIEFTTEDNGHSSVLGVRNTGSYIPSDKLETIFHPFSRLQNSEGKEGTGIGLSLCKKIVARHRGRIWAESSTSIGTHIKFTIGEENL